MSFRWWKNQRFHIFISRYVIFVHIEILINFVILLFSLCYRLLQEYISEQDPHNNISTFLHNIQRKVTFHVISKPLSEMDESEFDPTFFISTSDPDRSSEEDSKEDKYRYKRRRILKSRSQIAIGAPPLQVMQIICSISILQIRPYCQFASLTLSFSFLDISPCSN